MAERERHGAVAAWLVLISMGGTNLTFNIYHALQGADHGHALAIGLAFLYGVIPVAASLGLSHMVAAYEGSGWMRGIAFTVMVCAMSLSVEATAVTIKPVAGPEMCWVFPGVVDTAALVALRFVIGSLKKGAPARPAASRAPRPRRNPAAPVPGSVVEPGSAPALPASSADAGTGTRPLVPAGTGTQGPRAPRRSVEQLAEEGRAAEVRVGQKLSVKKLRVALACNYEDARSAAKVMHPEDYADADEESEAEGQ